MPHAPHIHIWSCSSHIEAFAPSPPHFSLWLQPLKQPNHTKPGQLIAAPPPCSLRCRRSRCYGEASCESQPLASTGKGPALDPGKNRGETTRACWSMAKKIWCRIMWWKRGVKEGWYLKDEFTSVGHSGCKLPPRNLPWNLCSQVLQLRFWAKYGKTSPPQDWGLWKGKPLAKKRPQFVGDAWDDFPNFWTSAFHRKAEEMINLNSIGSICRQFVANSLDISM